MSPAVRILLISGSLRAGSTNGALLRTAQAAAPAGIETVLYEGLGGLPHFNPDDDAEGMPLTPTVAALRAQIEAEDACVRIPVGRDVVGTDGLIADQGIRGRVVEVLHALARHAADVRE